MSQVQQLLLLSKETASTALSDYEAGTEKLNRELAEANTRSATFLESAQAICKHERVSGSCPKEPGTKYECTICGKEIL